MDKKNAYSARFTFAANVRRLREQRGLSQEKLAELADVHRAWLGSVERGASNISIDNMEQLAKALGVQLGELLVDKHSG
jgi:transcriptional regulator with XRE-family HTH domain